jgi:hypothetical protein
MKMGLALALAFMALAMAGCGGGGDGGGGNKAAAEWAKDKVWLESDNASSLKATVNSDPSYGFQLTSVDCVHQEGRTFSCIATSDASDNIGLTAVCSGTGAARECAVKQDQ